MTLTDFLLARIAEDEEVLQDIRNAPEKCEWGELRRVQPYIARHTEQFSGPRMEAECKAKGRIVDDALDVLDAPFGRFGRWFVRFWVGGQVTHTLRLLALPYADHPDYREEWRT